MPKINTNLILLFLILSLFCISSGCKKNAESASQEEVVFNDAPKNAANNEIAITDHDLNKQRAIADQNQKPINYSKNAPDGSRIDTAVDKFGNKNETRCFNNSRIKCLRLSTYPDGRREAQVFGHNGQTKTLPEEMLDRALTAAPDEIANSVNINVAFKATRPGL
jgi:hypothetical protein